MKDSYNISEQPEIPMIRIQIAALVWIFRIYPKSTVYGNLEQLSQIVSASSLFLSYRFEPLEGIPSEFRGNVPLIKKIVEPCIYVSIFIGFQGTFPPKSQFMILNVGSSLKCLIVEYSTNCEYQNFMRKHLNLNPLIESISGMLL